MAWKMTEPPGNNSVETLRLWVADNLRELEGQLANLEETQVQAAALTVVLDDLDIIGPVPPGFQVERLSNNRIVITRVLP